MNNDFLQVKILNGSLVDVDEFAQYREHDNRFGARMDFELVFPDSIKINDRKSREGWFSHSSTNSISVFQRYTWDGPSGPTFDTPSLRLASLVHDIICTKTARGYAVNGYWKRHQIYRDIAKGQNCPPWRANLHFGVLVSFNWIYSMQKKGRSQ